MTAAFMASQGYPLWIRESDGPESLVVGWIPAGGASTANGDWRPVVVGYGGTRAVTESWSIAEGGIWVGGSD